MKYRLRGIKRPTRLSRALYISSSATLLIISGLVPFVILFAWDQYENNTHNIDFVTILVWPILIAWYPTAFIICFLYNYDVDTVQGRGKYYSNYVGHIIVNSNGIQYGWSQLEHKNIVRIEMVTENTIRIFVKRHFDFLSRFLKVNFIEFKTLTPHDAVDLLEDINSYLHKKNNRNSFFLFER